MGLRGSGRCSQTGSCFKQCRLFGIGQVMHGEYLLPRVNLADDGDTEIMSADC